MSEGLYGADELTRLVEADDVFDGVFACLEHIWDEPEGLADRGLGSREYRTRLLEQQLHRQLPDLYDQLQARMGSHPITQLDSGCGVIMDALSLRETFQFRRDFPDEHGWDVSLDWAAVERLPSETTFICREWFDAHAPSAVNRDDFRFIGGMDVPQLPGTDPEYVWTRHPDRRLEDALKGNYSTEDVAEIYEDTKRLLRDVIRESGHSEFLVTSDHGYVNYLGGNPYSLSEDDEDALSSEFSGRYREVGNAYVLKHLTDAGIIERVGDHYVVRGHYAWTKRGASKRVMHGGLSLPECLTPVMRINTEA